MSEHESNPEETEDRELESLLAAVARAPRMARPPRVGDVIGERYAIESLLGRGGMGHVFAARDMRTERTIALKWMTRTSLRGTESDRRAQVARFLREARIAAAIVHPNVVAVYDVKVDDESPYLVMERLRGETLRARIDRAPLTWDDALALLLPAMRGVAALHRSGIVHRDLKPDNIFLCAETDDVEATTKVLDFGISHVSTPETDGLTRTGAMLGTPSYMPLEQLRGAKRVGPEVDVYALGVVLYEMLAGERPFDARSTADHAVLLATQKPKHLGDRIPSLAGARAEAVMRALAREPEDRFRSVDAFAEALRMAKPRRGFWPAATGVALVIAVIATALAWPRADASMEAARAEPSADRSAQVPARTSTPVSMASVAHAPVVEPQPPRHTADALTSDASALSRTSALQRRRVQPSAPPPAAPPVAPMEQTPRPESGLTRATTLRPEDFR